MRTISLVMSATALVFGLAACDRPAEPRTSSPSAGATTPPAPQAPADPKPAPADPKPAPDAASGGSSGANHADAASPQKEPTRNEEQTQMPLPGQANDHSTTARDPKKP